MLERHRLRRTSTPKDSPNSLIFWDTKAPPDAIPVSDWVLSPNKGFVGADSGIELGYNPDVAMLQKPF